MQTASKRSVPAECIHLCKSLPGAQACVALAVLPVCDEWPTELELETEGKPLDQAGIKQCETLVVRYGASYSALCRLVKRQLRQLDNTLESDLSMLPIDEADQVALLLHGTSTPDCAPVVRSRSAINGSRQHWRS